MHRTSRFSDLIKFSRLAFILYALGAFLTRALAGSFPVAQFNNAPYTLIQGQSLMLDASPSYDPDAGDYIAFYSWDINNDSIFGDLTGSNPTLSWATASGTYGYQVGNIYTINVRVFDSGALFTTASTTITTAIPEPSTYGIMAGVTTLGFCVYRRRRAC
ncbi:MAG: PEP-CTERM sorting domain-containing protein [Verrucomicrobia bacterium]|nr:PEP-CTERM sorting domain-containing protein [Verrucomicrobiota bacterium]